MYNDKKITFTHLFYKSKNRPMDFRTKSFHYNYSFEKNIGSIFPISLSAQIPIVSSHIMSAV